MDRMEWQWGSSWAARGRTTLMRVTPGPRPAIRRWWWRFRNPRTEFTLHVSDALGMDLDVDCPIPETGTEQRGDYSVICGSGRLTISTYKYFADTIEVQLEESEVRTFTRTIRRAPTTAATPAPPGRSSCEHRPVVDHPRSSAVLPDPGRSHPAGGGLSRSARCAPRWRTSIRETLAGYEVDAERAAAHVDAGWEEVVGRVRDTWRGSPRDPTRRG